MAKIRLARNQLARNPELVATTLAKLQEEAQLALEDLLELAHRNHPPVLSDRGLLHEPEDVARPWARQKSHYSRSRERPFRSVSEF